MSRVPASLWLYIFVFLHQTATGDHAFCFRHRLYIFVFLHQTATRVSLLLCGRSCISLFSYIKPQQRWQQDNTTLRCISLFSYIKPQLLTVEIKQNDVVYLCFPTSNRNHFRLKNYRPCVVYLCFPTSNRNSILTMLVQLPVVYLCFPTSNRNLVIVLVQLYKLYIFVFLHQTATLVANAKHRRRCISLFSYIKPQPYLR